MFNFIEMFSTLIVFDGGSFISWVLSYVGFMSLFCVTFGATITSIETYVMDKDVNTKFSFMLVLDVLFIVIFYYSSLYYSVIGTTKPVSTMLGKWKALYCRIVSCRPKPISVDYYITRFLKSETKKIESSIPRHRYFTMKIIAWYLQVCSLY